jgi:NAD(P)-dependent dehydrogenase (short-subunit alcohol dehydrogenase family)
MTPRKYGKMVFLSSTSALGNRGHVNYSTAKAGLPGMARTLAIELGRVNINAVAPGFVDTLGAHLAPLHHDRSQAEAHHGDGDQSRQPAPLHPIRQRRTDE